MAAAVEVAAQQPPVPAQVSAKSAAKSKSIPLKVEIVKSNGKLMKFAASASADEIANERVTTKEGNKVICSQLYIKPEGELQTTFREFLETRGVKQSMGGFMCDYMEWSSKLPYDFPRKASFEYAALKYSRVGVYEMLKLKSVIEDW